MKIANLGLAIILPFLWNTAYSTTLTQCKSGAVYELNLQIEDVNGKQLPVYHFNGPFGKDLIQSSVSIEVAKKFACQENESQRWLADDNRDD